MFRLHLARFDGFVVAVGLWSLVATGLAISPSSYGIVLRNLGASSDGVLLMRMLLGLSGNAAITGALSSNASRFSWASVRDYAGLHCRLPVAP